MDKNEFLKELKIQLRWKLPVREICDVLERYGRYYDDASNELGSPVLVATEILNERYQGAAEARYTRQRVVTAGAVLGIVYLVFFVWPYVKLESLLILNWKASPWLLLTLIPALLILLAGWKVEPRRGKGVGWLSFADAGVFMAGFALWYSFMDLWIRLMDESTTPYSLSDNFLGRLSPEVMGPVLANMLFALETVVILLTLLCLVFIARGQRLAIPLIFLNFSMLCGTFEMMVSLQSTTGPWSLLTSFKQMLGHIAIGILIAAVLFVWISLKNRKGELE